MFILLISCQSAPEPSQPAASEDRQTEIKTSYSIGSFDPNRVSQEIYLTTREEVQQFINQLNAIIRARNFSAWRETLSQEYLEYLSSPDFLRQVSNDPLKRAQNRTIRNLNDYFIHVFVPSRNPDRIQTNNIDIVFINQTVVRAYTITTSGDRQTLYTLEKVNNSWKIINPESID